MCPDHPQFIIDRQTGTVPHEGATTMTKHRRLHALALALGLGLATAASAQTAGHTIRTGAVWVAHRQRGINANSRSHRALPLDPIPRDSAAPSPLLLGTPARADVAPDHLRVP